MIVSIQPACPVLTLTMCTLPCAGPHRHCGDAVGGWAQPCATQALQCSQPALQTDIACQHLHSLQSSPVLSFTTCMNLSCLLPADIVSTLRAAHSADPSGTRMGVDVLAGAAGDMAKLGIYESYKVKRQVRGATPVLTEGAHDSVFGGIWSRTGACCSGQGGNSSTWFGEACHGCSCCTACATACAVTTRTDPSSPGARCRLLQCIAWLGCRCCSVQQKQQK
jgi:hypothetical protein